MQKTYQPKFMDMIAATQAGNMRIFSYRQRLLSFAITFAAAIPLFFALGLGIGMWPRALASGWGVIVLLALVAAMVLLYLKLLAPWAARRAYAIYEASVHLPENTFTRDDTGLQWRDAGTLFATRWEAIEGIFATPNSLCFISGAFFYVLPLAVFDDASERKAFIEDALNRISPAAAARSRQDKTLIPLLA